MDPAMAIEAAALSKHQRMLDAMAQGESDVQRFYKNSVVFLTGSSGFLGKQLVQKLISSCQISKVYMLLRSKKRKSVQERLQEILKEPVYDNLSQQQPNFKEKVVAVEGDVRSLRLGIEDQDWKTLTEEVNVIFHVAATTRFDESLWTATLINVRGTREALLLGKSCKKLRSFVHISTAYSHATANSIGGEVREEFYKAPISPDALILMVESVELDRLNSMTNDLIMGWPNAYTFTKAVAEELIRTTSDGLPICIVRPGAVINSYLEPSPGWLDRCNYGGIPGTILGASVGVVHVFFINQYGKSGFVPCDYVNNAIIVAARDIALNQTRGGNETKIFTVTSTHRNPITYRLGFDYVRKNGREFASPQTLYYVYIIAASNKHWFKILSTLIHYIPAYIADIVCTVTGKERRFTNIAKTTYNAFCLCSYILINEWMFTDNNLDKLYRGLSEQDRAIFNFDITDIDWKEYFSILYIGLRKYILKDGLKDTEYGIKKQKYLRVFHYVLVTLFGYFNWKLFMILVKFIRSKKILIQK